MWTAERLRVSIQSRPFGSLFVVSNREPYMHVRRGEEYRGARAGERSGHRPGADSARLRRHLDRIRLGRRRPETVDEHDHLRVPPDDPQYTLRRVWLTKEEEEGYYFGFSNEGLWPLCHIAHTRPIFRAVDWKAIRTSTANSPMPCSRDGRESSPLVLVQDYHFALLPRMIKEARPDARVAIFWHIPWPNAEAFRICPWQRELLDGLLGADLIGFHIQAHCNNFLETVDHALESRIEWERFAVNRNGQTTLVRPFPISVDFRESQSQPGARCVSLRIARFAC